MNPPDQSPDIVVNNPLESRQTGERNICEVKRHPYGIITMYLSVGLMLIVLAVVVFGVAPALLPNLDRGRLQTYATMAFVVVTLLTFVFVAVSHTVYWGNRWILTTESLTQVLRRSLFDKQSSQLSLGNLEDVTAVQDGLLAHMFHFGVLRAETAGERSKFVFPFCPNPTYYAQQILNAREQFEQLRRPVAPIYNQPPTAAAPPASVASEQAPPLNNGDDINQLP